MGEKIRTVGRNLYVAVLAGQGLCIGTFALYQRRNEEAGKKDGSFCQDGKCTRPASV